MSACMMKEASERRTWSSQQPDMRARNMCVPCPGLCQLTSLGQVMVCSKPSKLHSRKGIDRSVEIQRMEATRMYEKLIHKARAIKLGAACLMLASWPQVGGARLGGRREQNLPTSVNRGR